jgi:hypothetical protein
MVLDFVVAAIALPFLGVGLLGVSMAIGAADDLAALGNDCAHNACSHHGMLVDRQRTNLPGGGLWGVGSQLDYCLLTLDLDSAKREVTISGPTCPKLTVPSPASAEIWRGNIVSVQTQAGAAVSFLHPSFALLAGLLRTLALVPAALCVMIIQYDWTRHRPVWKVHRHLFGLH